MSSSFLRASQPELRDATQEDERLLFGWANDPGVRENALNQHPIPWPQHVAWFSERMGDPDCRIFIGEVEGVPVGQIRFDRSGDTVTVTISIAQGHRGKGLGTSLITKGIDRWAERDGPMTFRAVVRRSNEGSIRSFVKAGFDEVPNLLDDDELLLFEKKI
jgi:RimJ/RimL family protein N-acetyltransferase